MFSLIGWASNATQQPQLPMRLAAWPLVLCAACSSQGAVPGSAGGSGSPGALPAADSSETSSVIAGTPALANAVTGAGAPGVAARLTAGSGAAGVPGAVTIPAAGNGAAGALGTAGITSAVSTAAAGSQAGASAGIGAAGGGGGGGTGPNTTQPLSDPEPDQLGRYEIVSEINVGVGYENPINENDEPGATYCTEFSLSFGQDEAAARKFAEIPADLNMALYTMYRPKSFEEGKTYPLLTWGNGTCALPEGYGTLLRHVASHGFIVVAANTRWTAGSGASAPMIRAIEWALKANADAMSPLYQRIDPTKIGAFGHSQGAGATWSAAADTRIRSNVVLNGSATGTRSSSSLFVSGDRDIVTEASQRSATTAQSVAAMVFYHMVPGDGAADGHLTLITEPERVVGPVTAWFRYRLNADPVGRAWFVEASCRLCGHDDEYEFLAKGLK